MLFLAQEDPVNEYTDEQPANEGDNAATTGKYNMCEIIYCQQAASCLCEVAAQSCA